MSQPIPFEKPRRIWVEGALVYVERSDGVLFEIEAEVALELGRKLGAAGGDAMVNKVTAKP